MRYLQIQIKGYRALADVTLPLRPLTVMIGPNGCGKTSVLDVFSFVKEATYGRLQEAITNRGGFGSLLTQVTNTPQLIEIGLKVDIESTRSAKPMHYSFTLAPERSGYKILSENLKWEPLLDLEEKDVENLSLLSIAVMVDDTPNITARYTNAVRENQRLQDVLNKTLSLASLDVSQRAPIRVPQILNPVNYPAANGENLFAAIHRLQTAKAYQSDYERLQETLRLAFPDFERIEFQPMGGGLITFLWYEKSLSSPLYPSQLSEGTLRFLWLTTVLLSPEPPPLILIDEPEVSLHPELLQILAALLQDASARTQLIVATHSSDLIRWLKPEEVVVIDKQDGKATFTWADDPALSLEHWLKEYTLADLWYMGNLGGRS